MEEVWKDIPGHEGLYQISNFGRVKSLDRVVKRKNQPDLPVVGKVLNSRIGKKSNTSGRKGVYFNKQCQKWMAYIRIKGKQTYLGVFDNKEDAIQARINKERELL